MARLPAIWGLGPGRLTLDCLGLGLCVLAATVSGCASSNASVSSSLTPATPSFMLSDQEKAERSRKDPAALHLAYGRFEEQVGQPGEARKSYEKALGENPHSVDAVLGMARLDQLADKPKEAEAGFQRALAMKPGDPAILAARGQFYASQRRWPEARRDLTTAIAAAPNVPIYKHQLAVAETRSGDINAGLAVFNQLVGPEKAHYNVAFLLSQDGRQDAAAQECRAALSLNPKFEPARVMLDQIQNHQVAGDSRGMNPAMVGGQVQPRNAATSGNGFAPVATGNLNTGNLSTGNFNTGNSNQPTAPTAQASWQTAPTGSTGMGTATRAVGSFDAALPKATGTPQSADYSNDPWATIPAPPK
jgi:Tfp pilus assembly protein PilF